jgi:hypothetical protein
VSSIDARLNRLMPALSARERGILVLRRFKEGTEDDRAYRATMPQAQTADFSHLIGLINACNIQVAAVLLVIERIIDTLEAKAMWAATLALMAEQAAPRKGKGARQVRVIDELPVRLTQAVLSQASATWTELRAVEIVTEEIAEEFKGEHPLRPAHADSIAQSKERLAALRELTGDYEMSDPPAEDLDALREGIKKWAG